MAVAPLLEGSWRYIGGGAIVFQAIKTYIFGKLVRYDLIDSNHQIILNCVANIIYCAN